jgi:cystathionine gamma-synthase
VQVINRNAAELSERLSRHPAVQHVYYPPATAAGAGRGGLMSIVLRSAAERTAGVFDRLQVCKGPNLGTNFTLCCPYTILAHYTELDEVEAVGVSRWLLRISVGTEPLEDLWSRFAAALDGV